MNSEQLTADHYRAIVEAAIDSAIISFDEAARITSWNPGAERIFGWSRAEMLGVSADRIFTPEDRLRGVPGLEFATARSEGRASDERWHLRRDGSRFYAHGAVTPLDLGGRTGYVKLLRDVTGEHETRRALERSRERAGVAIAAARLGTYDYRVSEDRLEWDDRCRELFGVPPGAPVSYARTFVRGVHPDDREKAERAVREALDPAGSGSFQTEYRTIGITDGKLRTIAARGQCFFENGEPDRLIGTVEDVTDAREAEMRLREVEERLRLAGRATNDTIWDWDLCTDRVLWNEALATAFGHAPADFETDGAWWLECIHPDDRARVSDSIHGVIDGADTDWREEYRFRRADGSYADVRDRGYVLRDADGRATRMVGALLDQSDRMAVERSLQSDIAASSRELDRLWRFSPDLQLATDRGLCMRQVNPAWTAILGYPPADLHGRDLLDLIHPDDRDATRDAFARAGEGPLGAFENRLLHHDGSIRWIAWVAAPSDGLVFATGRHVTAEKEAHETLRQTEEALRQSQKVEAVGQLTGGVAHDFNNLLTVIRGSVDLLRRPGLTEEKRTRYIAAIADTAERATRLTSQLLAFARRQALQPQVFDASASIASLRDMLRTLSGSRIEAHYELPDTPCFISADPSQFDTAIVNMAVNARDAMEGEGTLTIDVRRVDRLPAIRQHSEIVAPFVAVSITDTGTGIPADKLPHIFEPFFTTKGVGHGTGLGLSQVFGFAKQSNGEVTVDSRPQHGTTFTLYLPEAGPTGDAAVADAPLRQPLPEGSCVLVVEDNAEVGAFATQALAELGYGSRWANSAEAALAELRDHAEQFDAVFTDVVMPGRSGMDLAEDVRRLYPAMPVVLTSGYSHVLAEEGTRGFDLLRKPYSIEELAATLQRVIQTAPAGGR